MFIVSDSLVAVPLSRMLGDERIPALRWAERDARQRQAGPQQAPLPVSQDGTLALGELYPSSVDPQARYYLPTYRLHTRDGQYTTSLRLNPDASVPGAPLAWLTVELGAPAPPSRALRLLEIEHRAVARLGYTLPVQSADGSVRAASAEPSIWVELGPLERTDDPSVRRCRLPIHAKPDFDRLFQAMTDSSFGTVLEVRCFAEVGYRTYRQIVVRDSSALVRQIPRRLPRPSDGVLEHGPVPTPLKRLMVSPGNRVAVLGAGPLDVSAISAGPLFGVTAQQPSIAALRTAPQIGRVGRPAEAAEPIERAAVERQVVARAEPAAHTGTMPVLPVMVDIGRLGGLAQAADVQVAAATAVRELLRRSDMQIEAGDIDQELPRRAIPVGAILEDSGEPALVAVEVQVSQRLAFHFPLEANRPMFDLPSGGAAVHRLLKATVSLDGEQIEVYQDLGLPGQFYYEPKEFRLARSARLPDRPELYPHLLAAVVPLMSEGATGAEVLYQVQLAYEARPYLDGRLLDAARAQLAAGDQQAAFTPIVPKTALLKLQVPSDTDGDFVELLREGVEIDFEAGINDVLMLSERQFRTVFASISAGGIHGTVQVELIDGRTETVPLRLTFAETVGALFADTFGGPTGEPGMFRVTLRNRVESPVQIDRLDPVPLTVNGTAAVAYPQPAPATTVAPGESVALDYRLAPPDVLPTALKPSLSATVRFQADQLWERLLVNGGYTTSSFTIEAAVEPEYLGPPPGGGDPIAALRIDFDCGVTATLTAGAPRQSVTLRQPLLDHLLNRPEATRYRFRVTDVHRAPDGTERDGAQTGWASGEGSLSVQPALATLG